MKISTSIAASALACAGALAVQTLSAQSVTPTGTGTSIPLAGAGTGEEYTVLLNPGHTLAELQQDTGLVHVRSVPSINMHLLTHPPGASTVSGMDPIDYLDRTDYAFRSERNSSGKSIEKHCEDGITIHFQCTVAFVDGTGNGPDYHSLYPLSLMNTLPAQDVTPAQLTFVAVVDTGIDPAHPDLAGHIQGSGWDFVSDQAGGWDVADALDNDANGTVDEAFGHGTALAGLVVLMNPAARLLPVRAIDDEGDTTTFRIAEAIVWAVDNGADVINLGVKFDEPSAAVKAAIEYAARHNVTIVAAAGNTARRHVLFPASYVPSSTVSDLPTVGTPSYTGRNLLAVGGIDADSHVSRLSAYGPEIDLMAPATGITTTFPGGGYIRWNGTSMAAALTSGAASLVIGAAGRTNSRTTSELLTDTAVGLDALNAFYAGYIGHGRIDADAAVQLGLVTP